ncbi:MAG TPA: YidC/Oxa1 family membrane protein insertase [Acidimicrobiia bacterium]|nr:YidC/Oxa1 family membrane protein insertase [Acidimicrobiia bacterium]
MFNSLIDAFGTLQAFFYGLIPNYGISIVLITVAIRLLLYPMTSRQARSMAKMQKVQPEIKKLQDKYKNDRQKLNEEMMAFYKEHQINPLAGCLPLLLQFPIFIALFQVLRLPGGLKHIPVDSELFRAFCDNAETVKACREAGAKGLTFLGMDMSQAASQMLSKSLLDAIPYIVLLGLVIASGYYQSRQMTKLQKGRTTPQAQMMTKIFPVFFGVISYTLPAGVVLYFFVSNLWQIGQQAVVFGKEIDAKSTPKKPSALREQLFGGATRGLAAKEPTGSAVDTSSREPAPDKDEEDGERPEKPAKAEHQAKPAPPGPPKNRPNRTNASKKKKRKKRR